MTLVRSFGYKFEESRKFGYKFEESSSHWELTDDSSESALGCLLESPGKAEKRKKMLGST